MRSAFDAAADENEPLALVVLDLDHFKEINDAFGHPVGDQVLRAVAQELAVTARPGDVVARVGGEEFAWLIPRADSDRAFEAAERLRASIEVASIGPVRTVTISAGVCDTQAADSPGELFRLADAALYWAKNQGRNLTGRYAPHLLDELSEEERAAQLERAMAIKTVRALARAVDAKDPNTRRHSERVGEVAQAIAAELGWDSTACADLYDAALVHDVGKIGVPDAVLFKAGPLSDDEREQMRQHPLLGARMLAGVLSEPQVSWVRGHHERIDGQGYPDGLTGEAIPLGARILAIADSWDAMTSRRSYSQPRTTREALDECEACRGTQFCDAGVDALVRLVAEGRLPGIVHGESAPTGADEVFASAG
jgi:diguanylate cyclase (GGDEF)-like protein